MFDPPVVVQFSNGHGDFYGQDNCEGSALTVRYSWQTIGHNKTHFKHAFSQDGGNRSLQPVFRTVGPLVWAFRSANPKVRLEKVV